MIVGGPDSVQRMFSGGPPSLKWGGRADETGYWQPGFVGAISIQDRKTNSNLKMLAGDSRTLLALREVDGDRARCYWAALNMGVAGLGRERIWR
jgi:hypothetical protein